MKQIYKKIEGENYKVLINAYACSLYRGSEPGMGWKFVDALSNIAQVHVITEKGEFEEDIKRYFIEHPEKKQNLHFYFVESL